MASPEKDIDLVTGIDVNYETNKKRSNSETADYPRRRAIIAVGISYYRWNVFSRLP
jgi:hypothetical protein